eukprot:TRINITY_DN8552_c0_g1_i2.p1 TRINITY_DN8552_c0_g1~~TRINITY_DN8552_c0_g1_i2.p1  ORF type:complete len:377 (+),score=68.87 TRINITY_DN8552_c0_g1_i2:146-1276(+)
MAIAENSTTYVLNETPHKPKQDITDLLTDWNFNAFDWKEKDLLRFAVTILERLQTLRVLGITRTELSAFVAQVGKNYNRMHFHNLPHAVTVLHSTFLMRATVMLPVVSQLDEVALALAALCHDLDHKALTNSYYKNSKSELAEKHGIEATLEHHHVEVTFKLLDSQEFGILGNLTPEQRDRVRHVMRECILATDMGVHKDRLAFLTSLKEKMDEEQEASGLGKRFKYDYTSDEHLLMMQCILHTADLYNPFKPFNVAQEWATRLQREFNEQVKLEQSLGLEYMGFMEGSGPIALAKGEVGFISFVAKPWYDAMSGVYPEMNILVKILGEFCIPAISRFQTYGTCVTPENNIKLWKDEGARLEKLEAEKNAQAPVEE